MKKVILLLSVMTLALTSCSKNEDTPTAAPATDTSGILLKKEIYTDNSGTDETNYTYTGNKLNRITYDDGTYDVYIYTGDLITEIKYYDNSNALMGSDDYKYNASNQLIGYNDLGTGQYEQSFVHNSDGTISFTEFGDPGVLYFQNGEIVRRTKTYAGGVSEKTYTYDSMNSPFKNVIGFDKIAFTFPFADHGIFHNPLTFHFTSTGNPTDGSTFTYTFNSNNFPVTSTETTLNSQVGTTQFVY